MIEITTPVGRLVGGHPMVGNPQKDEKTGLPRMNADNTPQVQFYVGLAIPKGTEQSWNQTPWGQQIYNEALASFPNGEHGMAAFSWKVVDGDSQIPNKKMKKPCDREGYPGHWIIHASNGFAIKAYHRGNYEPTQQIQRKEEIKTGDYCRLVLSVKGNGAVPPNTPGVYINPSMFELYQAGIEIVSENAADPMATFGATAAQLPAGAMVDPNVPAMQQQAPAPTPGTVAPAPDFAAGPAGPGAPQAPVIKYTTADGGQWTREQLLAANYNEQQIAALPHT